MTTVSRRNLLRGASACGFLALGGAVPALAATSRRVFELYRADTRIGEQTISVARDGSTVRVDIDIDIKVRILGIAAYAYALQSREIWTGGRLRSLEARTNDNGTAHSVSAAAVAGGVEVAGSGYSGLVPGNPATTTYWAQEFLTRPVWISTQDGRPMKITASRAGGETIRAAGGSISATRWQCRGDIGRLDLYYDAQGEWVGSEFDARGETARFVLRDRGAAMSPLWVRA